MDLLARITDALIVNLAFTGVYLILPLLFYWRRKPRGLAQLTIPDIVTVIGSAMSLQAVIGPIWTKIVPAGLYRFEPLCYFLVLVILLRLIIKPKEEKFTLFFGWHFFLLAAIIGAGTILRLLDPLQQAALAQSDAYSHLFFIGQIVQNGHLTGAMYPPGYHWVAALPALLLPIDPYLIARYGGAFFGALLVLAIFNLASSGRNRVNWTPGLIAAFLAACFPGSILLMKTAIGAYANQFGLFLLPVILSHYISIEKASIKSLLLLGLFCTGLLFSVPLMIINIALLIFIDLTVRIIGGYVRISLKKFLVLVPIVLLPFALLLLVLQRHQEFVISSAAIISNTAKPETLSGAFLALFRDYLSFKRIGFGVPLFDTALLAVGLFILCCLISAFYRRDRPFLLIALWSVLTFAETAFGLFQFSAYQRSGWQLIITLCLLGGYAFWQLFAESKPLARLRYVVLVPLLLSSLVSLHFYPHHTPVLSKNENHLIELLRFLDRTTDDNAKNFLPLPVETGKLATLEKTLPEMPQILIARQFSNFTHGDPISTILGHKSSIKLIPIGTKSRLPALSNSKKTMVIIDSCFGENPTDTQTTSQMMQPGQHRIFVSSRNNICRVNNKLLKWIEDMDRTNWNIKQTNYYGLKLYLIGNRNDS